VELFPSELWYHIFDNLTILDVTAFCCVSQGFYSLLGSMENLWEAYAHKVGPIFIKVLKVSLARMYNCSTYMEGGLSVNGPPVS
jgi:hypothetical protein